MGELNPKFEKYASGFSEVYKDYFGKEPTMGELVFNGWLGIKDKKLKNFKKAPAHYPVKNIFFLFRKNNCLSSRSVYKVYYFII